MSCFPSSDSTVTVTALQSGRSPHGEGQSVGIDPFLRVPLWSALGGELRDFTGSVPRGIEGQQSDLPSDVIHLSTLLGQPIALLPFEYFRVRPLPRLRAETDLKDVVNQPMPASVRPSIIEDDTPFAKLLHQVDACVRHISSTVRKGVAKSEGRPLTPVFLFTSRPASGAHVAAACLNSAPAAELAPARGWNARRSAFLLKSQEWAEERPVVVGQHTVLKQDVVEDNDGACLALHVDSLVRCGDEAEPQEAATFEIFEA